AEPTGADQAELEDIRLANEEITLLRKEQVEARQVDLATIHLRRGEISVDGQRCIQLGGQLVTHVQLWLVMLLGKADRSVNPICPQRHRGHDIESYTLPHAGQPRHGAGNTRVHLPVARYPRNTFVVATYGAPEVDTPGIRVR